eukprot:339568-Alexandrium_andersonii.AAC.1
MLRVVQFDFRSTRSEACDPNLSIWDSGDCTGGTTWLCARRRVTQSCDSHRSIQDSGHCWRHCLAP